MSLTRADIEIWVINLPNDAARRKRMDDQLKPMGLTYKLFEAIDGSAQAEELRPNVDQEAYRKNMGTPILPGKMGVYSSHISVWERFLSGQSKAALIFEDDVIFHADFNQALDCALDATSHWDLIRFNCIRAKLPVKQRQVGRYTLNAYIGPFTGNAAYLIKRETANKIMQNIWPQTRALDHELNRFFVHNYRQIGLEPWASHPDDGGVSTITGANFDKVKKPKPHQRLYYYGVKLTNYFRRAGWLARNGMLFPKR
ncbi:MAG: glycosyltransferase family 25 protein [Pseudomonadota bacterium]